uniref:Uncharacterized protein n=1 Tax=Magallana gigas TaxID=29159 RepID=A0A8W8MFD4_MAGGI
MLIFIIATFFGYFGLGIPVDESLIIGVWSPASLKVFTEIPKDSTSSFRNITIETTSSNLLITSLTSDPSK